MCASVPISFVSKRGTVTAQRPDVISSSKRPTSESNTGLRAVAIPSQLPQPIPQPSVTRVKKVFEPKARHYESYLKLYKSKQKIEELTYRLLKQAVSPEPRTQCILLVVVNSNLCWLPLEFDITSDSNIYLKPTHNGYDCKLPTFDTGVGFDSAVHVIDIRLVPRHVTLTRTNLRQEDFGYQFPYLYYYYRTVPGDKEREAITYESSTGVDLYQDTQGIIVHFILTPRNSLPMPPSWVRNLFEFNVHHLDETLLSKWNKNQESAFAEESLIIDANILLLSSSSTLHVRDIDRPSTVISLEGTFEDDSRGIPQQSFVEEHTAQVPPKPTERLDDRTQDDKADNCIIN